MNLSTAPQKDVINYSDIHNGINLSQRGDHLHMLIKLAFDAHK